MAVIDDIKSRLDIVEVISGYASLQRSGRAFKACCPFHQERTPSFYVNQERQSWHCFGACATGGDVFTFVMKAENLEFKDTLQRLANQAGVTLPSPERRSEQEDSYRLNEAAREYFQQCLASSMGSDTRAYLEQRGVSRESIGKFELGLSPRDGRGLFNHLTKAGFTPQQMLQAGAVHQSQDGGHRDAFRGRLIIPIRNGRGELGGFGSRALDDSMPKYLNTARTPVFDKGRTLYALYLAREPARSKGMVIVEGYMDAIMAHQHGFDNVVASMGTALTEHQVAEVRRLTANVTMALDADAAGQQATLRSLESSWQVFQNRQVAQARGTSLFQRQEDLNLTVAVLTDGKDPDEVIRQSPERWTDLVSGAVPLFDYLLPAVTAQVDASTPEGKARVVDLVRPFIYAVSEPIRQDSYVRKLAGHLSLREETLQAALSRPAPRANPARPAAAPGRFREQSAPPGVQPNARNGNGNGVDPSAFAAADYDPLEEYCLALLLHYPDLAADLSLATAAGPNSEMDPATVSEMGDFNRLPPEYFKRPENREIYRQLARTLAQPTEMLLPDDGPAARLRQGAIPELAAQVDRLAARQLPPIEPWARLDEFRQVVGRLEERHLKEMKRAEQARFAEDPAELPEEVEQETLNLNRRIKANQETRNQHTHNAIRGR